MQSNRMDKNSTAILSERIQQKHELLVQLRDTGLRQLELISSGDMNQLLKVLAAKQRMLGILQTVERALDPFRSEDPEKRIWRSPADRQKCAEMALCCESLLRAIVEQERQSESQMISRRNDAARRLRDIQDAAEIHRAYSDDPAQLMGQLDLTQG
jgi:hypothetical protein